MNDVTAPLSTAKTETLLIRDVGNLRDVPSCPRCGRSHDLRFYALDNPIVAGTETYGEWAFCPTTEQPVLFGTRELSTLYALCEVQA